MLPVFAILLTLCSSINAVNPNLDEIIPKQTRISQAGILANIGPDGVKSHGAKAGVVIASPSTDDPNYLLVTFNLHPLWAGSDFWSQVYLGPRWISRLQVPHRRVYCWSR